VDAVAGRAAIIFVLGGARSGKSEIAERLAGRMGPAVTYVATGPAPDTSDPGWAARVDAHRTRRPLTWATIEPADPRELGTILGSLKGPALVDSLGAWIAGLPDFDAEGSWGAAMVEGLSRRAEDSAPTVVVSDEVGLGVHPSTRLGGHFRDALGRLNAQVGAVASQAYLVVAGRALVLDDPFEPHRP
jgi:adenosyl cobinamide kinase/adenosyl cobinamide phosphate guanylyltransferase